MQPPKSTPVSDAPLGTEPRRPAWPLMTLLGIFAAWFAVLIFLAVRYPAR
jgi:hypothetical protein